MIHRGSLNHHLVVSFDRVRLTNISTRVFYSELLIMTMKNTWLLITSKELETMRNRLQEISRVIPDEHLDRIGMIAEIMDSVEQRLA